MDIKRIVLGVIAVCLSLIALYMTTAFYRTYGRDGAEENVFIALAVLSLAIKLTAPSAASMMRGYLVVQVALWLGFGAALCFDALGTGGYIEMTYGSKSGAAVQEASEHKDAEAARNKAQRDLEEYAGIRSTEEISIDLKAARLDAGKCTTARAHTDDCQRVTKLEGEEARAKERDRREATLANAQTKLDSIKKPSTADDAQASILRKLGSRIGWEGLGDFVALIISVLIFLFFEIVAPAMSFAALHGGSNKAVQKPPENRARPPDTRGAPPARGPRAAKEPAAAVLTLLNDLVSGSRAVPGISVSGRKVCAAQRTIGQACNLSGAAVNRHLTALKAAGTIALNTGPAGTEIELLN